MKFTRVSPVTGVAHTMDLPVTPEQYAAWVAGTHIQDAMPHLNADDREWLISGCTESDWVDLFGGDE